jgi:hypothetical protein
VPVYIALNDPAKWPQSTISVTINGAPAEPIKGVDGQSPFHLRRVPELAVIEVEAERDNVSLGRAKAKVYPPAMFLTIEKGIAAFAAEVGRLTPLRGEARAKLILDVRSDLHIPKGAVAGVLSRGRPKASTQEFTVDIGGLTAVDIEPGDLTITLRTPDGRTQTQDIALLDSQILRVQFATGQSPHEWLIAAAVAGAIREPASESVVAATSGLGVEVVGIDMDFRINPDQVGMRIMPRRDDGRFARYDVEDERPSRFLHRDVSAHVPAPPLFARVVIGRRTEYAVIQASVTPENKRLAVGRPFSWSTAAQHSTNTQPA